MVDKKPLQLDTNITIPPSKFSNISSLFASGFFDHSVVGKDKNEI